MAVDARLIRLRYPGECLVCAKELTRGDHAWWNLDRRYVTCVDCSGGADADTAPDLLHRTGWADEQFKRDTVRHIKHTDAVIRSAYADLGRLIWNVSEARSSGKIWGPEAQHKRVIGRMLDDLVDHGMIVLHDVRLPSEREKVDHIVVAPSGIHAIDTKHFAGERVHLRRGRRFIGHSSSLYVGDRDLTEVVDNMGHQVRRIYAFTNDLKSAWTTQVTPMLCFVDADWAWPRRRLALGSVEIVWPKALLRMLCRPGPLERVQIEEIGCRLASRLVYDFNDN